MATKINLKGHAKWNCPKCGSVNITFDGSDGGDETKMKDGKNELLSYSCKCKDCGAILMSSYVFVGNITLEQYNELCERQVDESCYQDC